jgi:hypothetical protein
MANSVPGPATKKLSAAEESELKRLEEEEAKKEALQAMQMQRAAAASVVPPPPLVSQAPRVAPRNVGDIPVTCLKDDNTCRLGNRSYVLRKGAEVLMDPSHAVELSQGEFPWVVPVHVVYSE